MASNELHCFTYYLDVQCFTLLRLKTLSFHVDGLITKVYIVQESGICTNALRGKVYTAKQIRILFKVCRMLSEIETRT